MGRDCTWNQMGRQVGREVLWGYRFTTRGNMACISKRWTYVLEYWIYIYIYMFYSQDLSAFLFVYLCVNYVMQYTCINIPYLVWLVYILFIDSLHWTPYFFLLAIWTTLSMKEHILCPRGLKYHQTNMAPKLEKFPWESYTLEYYFASLWSSFIKDMMYSIILIL